MVVINLISIPQHLVFQILQKTKYHTFIKILRTEKIIYELCYDNRNSIKIKLPDHTLQLTFDPEEKDKTSPNYQIQYRIRKAFISGECHGFTARIHGVINFDEFLVRFQHLVFFNFKIVWFYEDFEGVRSLKASDAMAQLLQMMRRFKMRAEKLEMHNTPLYNLAIDALRPKRFRSDFKVGYLMADCITIETLSKVKYMDYFSDSEEDAKGIINFVVPNTRYLKCHFGLGCEWIWPLLLKIIHKISRRTVINRRLSMAFMDTDLPDFEEYFKDTPHKYFKQLTDGERLVTAVFIDIVGTTEKLAIVMRTRSVCDSVHYSIVGTFTDFSNFYCEVLCKEMYDYSDAVKTDVFGLIEKDKSATEESSQEIKL